MLKSLEPLAFFIGTWNTNGEIIPEKNKPSTKITGTDRYEWTLDKQFILHTLDVMMGDEKTRAIEFIGNYDEVTKKYKMRSFDNNGIFTEMDACINSSGELVITSDKMRSKLIIESKNILQVQWERSDDNMNWVSWMNLILRK